MVTATEAIKSAVHHGFLERKKKLGWRKKYYVLTHKRWIYFDSIQSKAEARSSVANVDIIAAQKSGSLQETCIFILILFKKKKEYRAASAHDRDAWINAFIPVIGYSSASNVELGPGILEDKIFTDGDLTSRVDTEKTSDLPSFSAGELARIADSINLAHKAQLKSSNTISADEIFSIIKELYGYNDNKATHVGQLLLDAKLISSIKSQNFEVDTGDSFYFSSRGENKPQPKLSTSSPQYVSARSKSITERMSRKDFVAKQYAEEILKKYSNEKLDAHCQELTDRKERTIRALKEEISANYEIFIRTSADIKMVEKGMIDLKALVLDSRHSLTTLMSIYPVMTDHEKKGSIEGTVIAYRQQVVHQQIEQLDWELLNELLVLFNESNFKDLAGRLKDFKSSADTRNTSSTEGACHHIENLEEKFVHRLIDDFNISMRSFERVHKQETYLKYLNQLGYCELASQMCLMQYTVYVSSQVRNVPASGLSLKYVIDASRAFFNAILCCAKDFQLCFETSQSKSYVARSMWVSFEVERFAENIHSHVFLSNGMESSDPKAGSSDATYCMLEPQDFDVTSKHIEAAFRHIFYNARQLELAGIPAAHCLVPQFLTGIIRFTANYVSSFKRSIREQIKNERWEIAQRTIRSMHNKAHDEISITQSALLFYTMMQQFLRDHQCILNPAFETSFLFEIHEAVLESVEDLLIYYIIETTAYLRNPRLSSSLRPTQIISALNNIAYIQDDCLVRIDCMLQNFIPSILLEKRNLNEAIKQLWKSTVQTAMEQCAHAIWNMTIRIADLDLKSSTLQNLESLQQESKESEIKLMFLGKIVDDIKVIPNSQLKRSLICGQTVAGNGIDKEDNILSFFIVDAIMQYLIQESSWLVTLFCKEVGWGGIHCFLAECKALARYVASSSSLEQRVQSVARKVLNGYIDKNPNNSVAINGLDVKWMEKYAQIIWDLHQSKKEN